MATARRRLEWDQTARLMELIHNVNAVDPKDRVGPTYYHPCPGDIREPPRQVIKCDFSDLRHLVMRQ